MPKKSQTINKKAIVIGGGVVLVLVLLLVGFYGKNLTTRVYNGGPLLSEKNTADKECAAQVQKEDAQRNIDTLNKYIATKNEAIEEISRDLVTVEEGLTALRNKVAAGESVDFTELEKEKKRLEDLALARFREIVQFMKAIVEWQKILDLDTCPEPSPSTKPTDVPTVSSPVETPL